MLNTALKLAIQQSWSRETSYSPSAWTADNPAAGHCDVTSLVLRERLGYDLRTAQVFRNDEFSEHHYWNRTQDGHDLDATSSQFDGTETFGPITEMDQQFFTNAPEMRPELRQRLKMFRTAVDRHLDQQR